MKCYLIITIFLLSLAGSGQENFISVHQEESQYYKDLDISSIEEFDSVQDFKTPDEITTSQEDHHSDLKYRVFGYHPYWMGSAYLNYRWHLLSDLCYFSYEVDPGSGNPVTTHDFLTAAVVDSALANDVKVHLCATLFSGHATFFNSPAARQNLIDSLILYVQKRGTHGINIDFEAVPGNLSDELMLFIADLSMQFHQEIPKGILSIAMPAVDWNGMYDISFLNDYIDLYMIMGYDYYWSGSIQAGPVSPLYGFTSAYNYCLSGTLSYYLSRGMKRENMVLGIPYYARQWPTESGTIPSNTTGSGIAYKYSTIRNSSSGFYEPPYRNWDPVSFSNYYAFENTGWYQCFLEESYGLAKRYDIVKQRGISGAGIWALGYDNGYDDLWNIIEEKFTHKKNIVASDTIYDSGGPFRNYYNNENYCIYLYNSDLYSIQLNFTEFSLEAGFDSLYIFDGEGINSQLIGIYSGDISPGIISSTGPCLTLHFKSDLATTSYGWEAICSGTIGIKDIQSKNHCFTIPENPVKNDLKIIAKTNKSIIANISIRNLNGKIIFLKENVIIDQGVSQIQIHPEQKFAAGLYILSLVYDEGICNKKLMISN